MWNAVGCRDSHGMCGADFLPGGRHYGDAVSLKEAWADMIRFISEGDPNR